MAAIWVVAAWMFLHSNTILKTDMITFCFFNIFLFRSLFRTHSNIYDGAFLWKQLTLKKCWKNTTNKSWPHYFSFLRDLNLDFFFFFFFGFLSYIFIHQSSASVLLSNTSLLLLLFVLLSLADVIFYICGDPFIVSDTDILNMCVENDHISKNKWHNLK